MRKLLAFLLLLLAPAVAPAVANAQAIGNGGTSITLPVSIAQGGTGQATANGALNALLPTQTSSSGYFLTTNGTSTSWAPETGTGTVTSVGLSLPSFITVSGSPVTASGTLTGVLATQSANLCFCGPSTGSAAAPTFRALVNADIPANLGVGGTSATGSASGDVTSAESASAGKHFFGTNGTLYLDGGVTTGSAFTIHGGNFNQSSGNAFNAGNSSMSSTGITSAATVRATLSSVVSYVPPVYVAAGTSVASTMHCISDTVTAAGISTTVTLTAPAAFASANYALFIEDETGLSSVLPTAQSSSSFTFTSVTTHVYAFHACAP
jgi:hypothetical protein